MEERERGRKREIRLARNFFLKFQTLKAALN